jgi:hypothetical protein
MEGTGNQSTIPPNRTLFAECSWNPNDPDTHAWVGHNNTVPLEGFNYVPTTMIVVHTRCSNARKDPGVFEACALGTKLLILRWIFTSYD